MGQSDWFNWPKNSYESPLTEQLLYSQKYKVGTADTFGNLQWPKSSTHLENPSKSDEQAGTELCQTQAHLEFY